MVHVALDPELTLREQPQMGHNRWHPDLAPVASVAPGEELLLDLRDSMDGEVKPGSSHETVMEMPPISHTLTGPVAVEGAQPGHVLALEILEYTTADFGWTAVIPDTGTLGDLVERPYLVRWEIAHGVARSGDLPGVAVPARTHAGVIGVAPSRELFDEALRRERALADAGHPVRLPDRTTAFPERAADGLRTTPPRENGGNLDVCDLGPGAILFLPVHVPGALLSAGDLHFAQGDGEVSMYAIETSGSVRFRVGLHETQNWTPRCPTYEAPPRVARATFATTGIPLDDAGENAFLDIGLATRRALIEMVGWLRAQHGFSFEQAYALCSVAAELRISQAVDLPNALVSVALPLDVFEDA
jgi:formamidase